MTSGEREIVPLMDPDRAKLAKASFVEMHRDASRFAGSSYIKEEDIASINSGNSTDLNDVAVSMLSGSGSSDDDSDDDDGEVSSLFDVFHHSYVLLPH